jgi:hypothetical protein
MKFIAGHKKTQQALARWTANNKCIVAGFYFWSSGSPMQRSQEGLLRCLLYQILSQAPEMIHIAAPRKWQADDRLRTTEPWTRREISNAFSNVVNSTPLSIKFCFFIDGLDEFGGTDQEDGGSDLELVSQLKKLASSPHVKLCLSSRPRNIFQLHLISDESRHIILHNHTRRDIEQFVQSRIACVRQLVTIDASDLKRLQHMIAERSSGVFLWVVLVVRELLDGLAPPFSMPEMEERLLSLPEILEDYFRRILDKVHPQHRRFTARLLLLSIIEVGVHGLALETAFFFGSLTKRLWGQHNHSGRALCPKVGRLICVYGFGKVVATSSTPVLRDHHHTFHILIGQWQTFSSCQRSGHSYLSTPIGKYPTFSLHSARLSSQAVNRAAPRSRSTGGAISSRTS